MYNIFCMGKNPGETNSRSLWIDKNYLVMCQLKSKEAAADSRWSSLLHRCIVALMFQVLDMQLSEWPRGWLEYSNIFLASSNGEESQVPQVAPNRSYSSIEAGESYSEFLPLYELILGIFHVLYTDICFEIYLFLIWYEKRKWSIPSNDSTSQQFYPATSSAIHSNKSQ